jgi:hypothetical protein
VRYLPLDERWVLPHAGAAFSPPPGRDIPPGPGQVHLRSARYPAHAWSVLDPDDQVTLHRLSDLERVRPADETLRALLGTLNTKLDLCTRLPFLAYQADREGFEDAAASFRAMAVQERRSLADLLVALRSHLDLTQEPVSQERTS